MANRETVQYQRMKEALEAQEGIVVIDAVTQEPRFDGKKGVTYVPAIIRVAPNEAITDVTTLNNFSAGLLGDSTNNVYRFSGERVTDEGQLVPSPIRSFDVLGERTLQPIFVEVFSSQEAVKPKQVK